MNEYAVNFGNKETANDNKRIICTLHLYYYTVDFGSLSLIVDNLQAHLWIFEKEQNKILDGK